MRRIVIALLIVALVGAILFTGCVAAPPAGSAGGGASPPPPVAPPDEIGEEVTLADAPTILDLSSELPRDFDYNTSPHVAGYEYVKLGLGPWSEWHTFVRVEPFQVVNSTMTVLSGQAEITACDELLEDPDHIRSVYEAWYQGKKGEDLALISMDVYPADIGDVAVLISTETTQKGYIFQGRSLYFRCQNVVVLVSTFYSIEEPPIIELARTIEQRIRNY